MAEVAVIMAAYNGEKFIAEQIDSILDNSFTDIELHICDDGSTDRTEQIASVYVDKYPDKIHYHKNEKNLGVIRNFLYGLIYADCPYYMFSDQDDVWEKDKILHTLDKMKSEENSHMAAEGREIPIAVFGDAYMVDGELRSMNSTFQKLSNLTPADTGLPHVLVENAVIGCTLMINRCLRNKLQTVPEQVRMHDHWIAIMAAALGRLVYLDEPLLKYRQHGNNTLGGASDISYATSNLGRIKKIKAGVWDSYYQAGAFLDCFENELTEEQKSVLSYFADIPNHNWFVRKYRILHGGFYKTGFIKNTALLLLA